MKRKCEEKPGQNHLLLPCLACRRSTLSIDRPNPPCCFCLCCTDRNSSPACCTGVFGLFHTAPSMFCFSAVAFFHSFFIAPCLSVLRLVVPPPRSFPSLHESNDRWVAFSLCGPSDTAAESRSLAWAGGFLPRSFPSFLVFFSLSSVVPFLCTAFYL